jgi:hypothetical protein
MKILRASFGALILSASVVAGTATAHAIVGTTTADTVNYKYTAVQGGDSSTCGPDWANDVQNRTFKVYKEQANNGAYQVTETFTGSFTTIAGPSPESCEAGTTNTVNAGIKGSFHGYETLIVHNGTWSPTADISCSSPCTTTGWIANAFGGGATFDTADDWWFSYKTTNAKACVKHWINANYGNSGDIATTCS